MFLKDSIDLAVLFAYESYARADPDLRLIADSFIAAKVAEISPSLRVAKLANVVVTLSGDF